MFRRKVPPVRLAGALVLALVSVTTAARADLITSADGTVPSYTMTVTLDGAIPGAVGNVVTFTPSPLLALSTRFNGAVLPFPGFTTILSQVPLTIAANPSSGVYTL